MKSLADLRADKDTQSAPTLTAKICLDQAVLAEIQRLNMEKADLRVDNFRSGGDEQDQDGQPQRLSGPEAPPRLAEIGAELEALYDRMRESEGELLLQAISGGDWQRWKDAHPARKDNQSDKDIAYGLCNATDLLEALGKFVVAWNGDDFGPGEWDGWFRAKVAPADLSDICSKVVSLHEAKVTVPKSSSVSSGDPTSAIA